MSRAVDAVDSPVGAAARFALELTAWAAAPLAVARTSAVAAVLVLVVLVALPSICNVPGDKQHTPVAVPGLVRIGVELILMSAALVGAAAVLPRWAAVVVLVVAVGAVIAGWPRWRWLHRRGTAATSGRRSPSEPPTWDASLRLNRLGRRVGRR